MRNVKCHVSDFSHHITSSHCITIISSNILHARWQKSVRHPRHISSHVHTLIPHISIYWNCIKVQFPSYQEPSNVKHVSYVVVNGDVSKTRKVKFFFSRDFWLFWSLITFDVCCWQSVVKVSFDFSIKYYNVKPVCLKQNIWNI